MCQTTRLILVHGCDQLRIIIIGRRYLYVLNRIHLCGEVFRRVIQIVLTQRTYRRQITDLEDFMYFRTALCRNRSATGNKAPRIQSGTIIQLNQTTRFHVDTCIRTVVVTDFSSFLAIQLTAYLYFSAYIQISP